MKKKLIALTIALVTALGMSACGSTPSQEDNSSSGSTPRLAAKQEASDNDTSAEVSDEPSSQPADQGDADALTDWYNSDARTQLEDTVNEMFKDQGLTFYVEIEEPNLILYNYQYADQLDLSGVSQEDIAASYSLLDSNASVFLTDIRTLNANYGLSVTTLRVSYLNADGTMIYSRDFSTDDSASASSDDSSSSGASASEGTYTLAEWYDSDERTTLEETVSQALNSQGLAFTVATEGTDTLIVNYQFIEQVDLSSLSQEEMDAALSEVMQTVGESAVTLFDPFETEYGITLSTIRVVILNADGTTLISQDFSDN